MEKEEEEKKEVKEVKEVKEEERKKEVKEKEEKKLEEKEHNDDNKEDPPENNLNKKKGKKKRKKRDKKRRTQKRKEYKYDINEVYKKEIIEENINNKNEIKEDKKEIIEENINNKNEIKEDKKEVEIKEKGNNKNEIKEDKNEEKEDNNKTNINGDNKEKMKENNINKIEIIKDIKKGAKENCINKNEIKEENQKNIEKKNEEEKVKVSKVIEKESEILLHINPISKDLIQYLKKHDIEEYLDDHTKQGLVGLLNLGNTCFMNSAIQCLSNCELLTKYFLSSYYKKEINSTSKFSSGGNIATSYAKLLEKLWKQNKPYIIPNEFYNTFISYVKTFNDSSQHDSHEMLIYLLEKLHEDLNRNVEKEYIQLNEKGDNESDIMASNRWWEAYLKRDNSIIMDLFLGQFKSTVKCPFCDKVSITYDQFSCLELPIENKCFFGTSYVINEKENKIRKINLIFGENEKFKEICEKINCQKTYKAILCRKSKMYLACLKDEHNLYELINIGQKKKFEVHNRIIFYEYEKNQLDNKLLFFVVPIVFFKYVDSASGAEQNEEQFLFFPKIFYYSPNDKIEKFYEDLKNYYYKYYKEKDSNFSDEKIKLRIVNNLTACTKTRDPCDYCGTKECISCEFKFGKEMTMGELKNTQSKSRSFVMYLEIPFENFKDKNLNSIKLYDNYLDDEDDFELTEELSLENCFNSFSRCEKLDESNEWYCPKCKEHRRVYKQMEIFRLPIYLILQLKRFKNQCGFFFNSKNSTYVKFPLEGLDLNKYLVGPRNINYIYDLISVSQHFGFSFIGHYTSVCKKGKSWYKFDDEKVFKKDEDNIVDSNAYILVYKLRD